MLNRSDYSKLLGYNVLIARASKQMSRRQVAEACGGCSQSLYRIETGEGCTMYTLFQVATGLGVDPAQLLPSPAQIARQININDRLGRSPNQTANKED